MTIAHGPAEAPRHPYQWWEYRWAVAALMLLSMVPLMWPDVPPLVDLPGHLGRYRVQLDLATSPELQQFYTFEWAIIGNLGIDLLVQLFGPLFGIEPVVKTIVLLIPALTAGGLLWVAREVHGRVPPTAMFALPFAYNFPFLFGFINFALAMALALLAFALWLRLARLGRLKLRAILFVPIASVLWVVHAYGWGTLGVLAFSAELVRQFDRSEGQTLLKRLWLSGFWSGIHCLSLVPPVGLMLLWRSGASGQTLDWFHWESKLSWVVQALRDRWMLFDIGALALVGVVLIHALFSRNFSFSRNLVASALSLIAAYILIPRVLFGSAYADMRLVPYAIAIALIAIRLPERVPISFSRAVALVALAFMVTRTAGTTASMALYDHSYDRELAALAHLPRGAKVVSFAGRACHEPWAMSRLLHLPAMATVRNNAFSNDQWTLPGAQLLQVDYPPGRRFVRDPSQVVTPWPCARESWRSIDLSLARFPRAGFDYVWLITPPPYDPRFAADLRPVWRNGASVLYRVDRSAPPVPAAVGPEPLH